MVVLLAAGGAGGHLTNLLVGLATVVVAVAVAVARNPATRRAAAGASAGASASGQVTLRQAASPRLSDRLQAGWGAALRDAYQVCSRIQLAAKGPLSAPCASHSRTGGARSTWSRSSQQARSGFRMT